MCGRWISALVTSLTITISAAAQEPAPPGDPRPPYERLLTGDDARRADALQEQINAAEEADRYADANSRHEELLALRIRVQGADHWEVVNQRWAAEACRAVANLPPEQRRAWRSSKRGAVTAQELVGQGRIAEAHPFFEEHRRSCVSIFGEKHPETATSSTGLGVCLNSVGRLQDAQSMFQQALDVRREMLGDRHPDTAFAWTNLGANLDALGQFFVAEPLHRKALDLNLDLLGERHPDTATSFNNLAGNLQYQGRYADAELLMRKCLDLCRELHGEQDFHTIGSYNNLAVNLKLQGRHGEAQPYYEKALTLIRALLGDKNRFTVACFSNLALNLDAQGKQEEARALLEHALELCRTSLGERDIQTAMCHGQFAYVLARQGRYAEAQPHFQMSFELRRSLLGESHVDTLNSAGNLASNLSALKRYADAEPLQQHVLELRRKLFVGKDPRRATCLVNLGDSLYDQGRYGDAQPLYQEALDLDRELLGEQHPDITQDYVRLACVAYLAGEYGGARTLLASGAASYEAARLNVADHGLERAAFGAERSPYSLLAVLESRLGHPAEAWTAVEHNLARGLNDQIAARDEASLSPAEATRRHQLGVRLAQIQPRLIHILTLPSPTVAEQDELRQLREERRLLQKELADLAAASSQRAVAAPASIQSAIPDDAALVLWVDLSKEDGLQEHWACVVRSSGGPRWEPLSGSGPEGAWTDDDIALPLRLMQAVTSHAPTTEIAALADELYTQRIGPLQQHVDGVRRLFIVPVNLMAGVPVDLLTDQYTVSYVPSGTFLARLKDIPAAGGNSLLALGAPVFPDARPSDGSPFPLASRGGDWAELPGTSVEVARLASLVGPDQTTALTRSDASEQSLEQLRAAGKLKDYRYLHFATHGEPNNARAFESALILAQDQITGEVPKGGGKYYDGRLTANEVLETWELNADLVTLSACESALGRPGGGDGLLGFAQAFLLAGARSVCLSLWKVDDTATALFMDRFYQNLLGKRDGLEEPMPKAEALAEAKQWLRKLTTEEAKSLTQDISAGVSRGKGDTALPVTLHIPEPKVESTELDHPFSHPRYWAAFVLIGDPE